MVADKKIEDLDGWDGKEIRGLQHCGVRLEWLQRNPLANGQLILLLREGEMK